MFFRHFCCLTIQEQLAVFQTNNTVEIAHCIFYGVVFNDPPFTEVAQLFPPGGGYGTLFNGRVVDMIYLPLASWDWPLWMPMVGGEHFVFFQPIFNVADACLSVSVVVLILFYSGNLATIEDGAKGNDTTPKENK